MNRMVAWLTPLVLLAGGSVTSAEIVFENARLRAVLGEDACWKMLQDRKSGANLLAAGSKAIFAAGTVAGKSRPAVRAALAGDKLAITLAGAATTLTYSIERTDDWIGFRLESIAGPRPTELTLARIAVNLTAHAGTRLGAGWDDRFAVCLMATGLQAQGRALRRGGWVELAVTAQDAPGPRLEGAGAALTGAPPGELPGLLWRLAEAYDLPRNGQHGLPSHQLPIARQPYWFIGVTEHNVDRIIEVCEQSGIRQVLFTSGSWCRDVGHYTFRKEDYPNGMEGLRQTVAKLHARGILAGMHCFASKISKTDAYVRPIPDRRFWLEMSAPLAADAGPGDTELRLAGDLSQWPGSPRCKRTFWEGGIDKHREVVVDGEIVRYASIGPESRWDTLQGCVRGWCGTAAAAHRKGAEARRYGVDGCIDGYIIDQETSLLEETTTRLAEVFNTCDFDMVYFDGGEDVDRTRFNYYVSNFQAVAMRKFKKRPLMHLGTICTHNLWNSFTRSGTVDTYLNTLHGSIVAGRPVEKWPSVRDHIQRSVEYLLSVREDMLPGELGWFGIWPRGEHTDGLQLDETEYLMAKSIAYDAPVSFETSLSQMDQHPLTPGILELVARYERLRMAGSVPEPTRRALREPGKDFILVPGEPPEFVPAQQVPHAAGSAGVRAWAGPRGGGTIASLWHSLGAEGTLLIDDREVTAIDGLGRSSRLERSGGKTPVPLGPRRTLVQFPSRSPAEVTRVLARAVFAARPPATLWIEAESFARIGGKMSTGAAAGLRDTGASGDFVAGTGPLNAAVEPDGLCEYRVHIPHAGMWTLWARVRYPRGGDMSFSIDLPDAAGRPNRRVLGNCGLAGTGWHWTGSGGGVNTAPPGSPIQARLPAGEIVLRVHPREGHGSAATNPRLDVLCLTEDRNYVPSDADPPQTGNPGRPSRN